MIKKYQLISKIANLCTVMLELKYVCNKRRLCYNMSFCYCISNQQLISTIGQRICAALIYSLQSTIAWTVVVVCGSAMLCKPDNFALQLQNCCILYMLQKILFLMCAGNELFYCTLYLIYFTSGPQGSFTVREICLFNDVCTLIFILFYL